jgi:hypothetical protein
LADLVSKAFDTPAKKAYFQARNEVVHAYSTHAKAAQIFGHLMQETPIETGIERMANWVKKQGARKAPIFEQIEILQKLPQAWK